MVVVQWFTAVYTGLVAATYCCLLINGFVGFQFAEDGTPLSLWVQVHRRSPQHFADKFVTGPPDSLPGRFRCRVLCRNRDLQAIRGLQIHQSYRPIYSLYSLAINLRLDLHRFTACPRVPHARGPMAYR